MPIKTRPELFGPIRRAFWVLPKTGIAELAFRDNLGSFTKNARKSATFRRFMPFKLLNL